MQEELVFNADSESLNDSHIHVQQHGDQVHITAPRGCKTPAILAFLQDQPVSYVPFNYAIQAVYDMGDDFSSLCTKRTRHQDLHTTLNKTIVKHKHTRQAKSEEVSRMDTRSHDARDIGAHVVSKPGTVPDAGRRSASLHSSTMLRNSEEVSRMDTRSHEARDIGAHVVNKPGTVPDAGRRSASLHSSTMLSKSEPKSLLDSRSSETHSSQALQEQTFHSASLHASHGDSLRQDLAHHSARSSSDGRGQDSTRSRSSTHEVHSGNSPSSSNDIFTFGGDTPSRYKRTRHVSSIDKVPSNKRTRVSPESDSSSARRSDADPVAPGHPSRATLFKAYSRSSASSGWSCAPSPPG